MHLLDLGKIVKKGIAQQNAMIGFQFGTVGVSDAISMGTDGMNFSLQSREVIADSIETIVSGKERRERKTETDKGQEDVRSMMRVGKRIRKPTMAKTLVKAGRV